MDLKEFISETIVQIVAGVEDARSKVKDKGVSVNPQMATTHSHAGRTVYSTTTGQRLLRSSTSMWRSPYSKERARRAALVSLLEVSA